MAHPGTARCALAMSMAIASAAPAFAQGLAPSVPTPAPAGGQRIAEPAQQALYRRATQADADALLGTLNRLLDAYQTGDLPGFDPLLASWLPGRQRVVEGLIGGLSGERHARIHLFNVQVTAEPETAAIQAG